VKVSLVSKFLHSIFSVYFPLSSNLGTPSLSLTTPDMAKVFLDVHPLALNSKSHFSPFV
jgi:hypothetical protein